MPREFRLMDAPGKLATLVMEGRLHETRCSVYDVYSVYIPEWGSQGLHQVDWFCRTRSQSTKLV